MADNVCAGTFAASWGWAQTFLRADQGAVSCRYRLPRLDSAVAAAAASWNAMRSYAAAASGTCTPTVSRRGCPTCAAPAPPSQVKAVQPAQPQQVLPTWHESVDSGSDGLT